MFFLLISFLIHPSQAKVRDFQEVLSLLSQNKAAVILSNFNPVTRKELKWAHDLQTQYSEVILVPNSAQEQKFTLTESLRCELLEDVLTSDLHLSTLSLSNEQIQTIRFLAPSLVFTYIEDPSFEVRQSLLHSIEIFLDPFSRFSSIENLEEKLEPITLMKIRERGMYVGKMNLLENEIFTDRTYTKPLSSRIQKVQRYFTEIVQESMTISSSLPYLKRITLGGKTYKIEKNLTNGRTANVYLIHYEGKLVVLKIPLQSSDYLRNRLLQGVFTQKWLHKFSDANIPMLVDYDINGNWAIYEYISAPTVQDVLKKRSLSYEEQFQIKKLYEEAKRLYAFNGMVFDFKPINLILKDGNVYLIDTGLVYSTSNWLSYESFDSLYQSWIMDSKRISLSKWCARLVASPLKTSEVEAETW